MSVVVPIKPEPPAPASGRGGADEPGAAPEPTDAEGWILLDGLRRRMDDQAIQTRKTAAQVTQLAESIAALVEVQRRRTRRLNLNSFVAYVIFTLLCGAGAYALYWSRSHELVDARDRATADRDAAVRRADDATHALAERQAADAKAALDARAADAQVVGGEAALKAAVVAFKAGRYGEVTGPLEAALANEPPGPRAAAMHYYVGVVAAKANELDKAIGQLEAALAGNVAEDDVRFQLASALDRKGEYAKARAEYDRFSVAHAQSPLAAFAMRRSATLARMPATAVPVVPPAVAAVVPKAAVVPVPVVPKAAVVPAPVVPKAAVPVPVKAPAPAPAPKTPPPKAPDPVAPAPEPTEPTP